MLRRLNSSSRLMICTDCRNALPSPLKIGQLPCATANARTVMGAIIGLQLRHPPPCMFSSRHVRYVVGRRAASRAEKSSPAGTTREPKPLHFQLFSYAPGRVEYEARKFQDPVLNQHQAPAAMGPSPSQQRMALYSLAIVLCIVHNAEARGITTAEIPTRVSRYAAPITTISPGGKPPAALISIVPQVTSG
jgi:hypothetical protein